MVIRRPILLFAALLAALPATRLLAQAPSQWTLVQSTITYHLTHPLHRVDGVSRAARGKGLCQNDVCSFLIAAPVNSFNSGDSNRDLHMLEVTRGALYPLVTVRTTLPQAELKPGPIHADLEIQFSGQTVTYKGVAFQAVAAADGGIRITGTIPATLSAFKVPPPKLLGIAIHDDMPISVDMTWRPD